jgi:hypothetical protein
VLLERSIRVAAGETIVVNQLVAGLAKRLKLSEARTTQLVDAVLGVVTDLGLDAVLGSKPAAARRKPAARKKTTSVRRTGTAKASPAKTARKSSATAVGKRSAAAQGPTGKSRSTKRSPKGR